MNSPEKNTILLSIKKRHQYGNASLEKYQVNNFLTIFIDYLTSLYLLQAVYFRRFFLGKIYCSGRQYRTALLCNHLCSQNPFFHLKKVILLDILEIFVGAVLQFVGGIFVADDDGMGMLLQAADGPHVVDRLFYTVTKGAGLVVTIHHDHHLLGIHDGANTNGQSGLGNQIDIIIEETTIGDDGIGSQCLLPGATLKDGAWLWGS